MKDIWFTRDLPILEAIVQIFEEHDRPIPNLATISAISGFPLEEVGKAAKNLNAGGYLDLKILMTGPDYGPWFIERVHTAALRATGAWPTPETLTKAVVLEFEKIVEGPSDNEEIGWLKRVMSGAGEVSKEVFIRVLTEATSKVLSPHA
jgi:hypothetical protein